MRTPDGDPMTRTGNCIVRHWFSPPGLVGVTVPECVRCGAPNPKYTEAVQAEMNFMGYGPDWWAEQPRSQR